MESKLLQELYQDKVYLQKLLIENSDENIRVREFLDFRDMLMRD